MAMLRSCLLFGAAALIVGCPSGKSTRGVEHSGTAQRHEDDGTKTRANANNNAAPNAGNANASTNASGGESPSASTATATAPAPATAGVGVVGIAAVADGQSCRGRKMGAWAPPGFCVVRVAQNLDRPRHLVVAPNGDLLVATRAGVVVLWDADGDGESDEKTERVTLGAPDFNHQGIALSPDQRWIYIADSRAVRRIRYQVGQHARQNDLASETVIPDVPLTVDHPYRTITFDKEGRLYLAVGSTDNINPGKGAAIRRYIIPPSLPAQGMRYESGEQFAVGIRNPEALAWDLDNRLWAFVNGRDFLHPPNTSDNFYLDHPGDWIYRLSDRPGTFYGFPNCWVLGPVPWGERRDPTSQWADPDVNHPDNHSPTTPVRDDAWCQNPANVHPAAGALPAHSAPLGAIEYTGALFPPALRRSFLVTSHGSWNRHGKQIGRTILHVQRTGDDRVSPQVKVLIGERSADGNLKEGTWSERPVGIAQGLDGAVYVTSDETGNVFRIGYAP